MIISLPLIVVAATGALWIFKDELEGVLHPGVMYVEPAVERATYEQQLAAARAAVPPSYQIGLIQVFTNPKRATGLGMSGGDFADTSFSSNVSDLVSAVRYLKENYAAPALLIGHSLGGAAVLAAAPQAADAKAVATIGAPFEAAHVAHLLKGGEETIRSSGEAEVDIGGRRFRVRKSFLDDLQRHQPAALIGSLRKALLVLHSPQDTTVAIDNAAKIFGAAKHPKSFVSLDGADHLLTRGADASYAAEVIAVWAARYIAPG